MQRSGNWRSITVSCRVLEGDKWNQEGYFTMWRNKACLYTNENVQQGEGFLATQISEFGVSSLRQGEKEAVTEIY